MTDLLLRADSLEAARRSPTWHELGKRMGDGKYRVNHPPGCECQILYSVAHAPWVSYNVADGIAACSRCGTRLDLPVPAVRESWASKRVRMDLAAVEDDLWNFQRRHEGCQEPPPPQSD